MLVKTTLSLVALVSSVTLAPAAEAQWARGAGPDAAALPAGSVRVGAATTWQRSIEAWGEGRLFPLGAALTTDALGASRISALITTDNLARTASGLPNVSSTLGALNAQVRQSVETTPLDIEYGVTSRISVGATVPFVTSIARVDAVLNSATANAGINPALSIPTVATANGALVSQIESASAFVRSRITSCAANPGSTGCSGFNAAAAQALVSEAGTYSTALALLFGGKNGAVGQPLVPTAGSATLSAIATRLADFKTRFGSFGANQISAAAPAGAAPATTADLQRILADTAFGVGSSPVESVVRRGIGDIELRAQVTWFDSFDPSARLWWRIAVQGTHRLGTGRAPDRSESIPTPLGSGVSASLVRLVTDIGMGTRWSVSIAPAFATRGTTHDNSEVTLAVAPRWTPTEAMSLAGVYDVRNSGGKRAGPLPEGTPFDLRDSPSGTEHRFGATLAYSSLPAFRRGGARLPLEISIAHFQSLSGSGFFVPKLAYDAVTVRWYWRARR